MASALDLAKCFIVLAGCDEEKELLTPLRVQKLLYYAQGWSLALRDKTIFPEDIHAWPWGPVVPKVYKAFKLHGSNGIPGEGIGEIELTEDERELCTSVWNAYKGFSAIKLSEMTHDEPPWKETPAQAVISTDKLSEYFKTLVEK